MALPGVASAAAIAAFGSVAPQCASKAYSACCLNWSEEIFWIQAITRGISAASRDWMKVLRASKRRILDILSTAWKADSRSSGKRFFSAPALFFAPARLVRGSTFGKGLRLVLASEEGALLDGGLTADGIRRPAITPAAKAIHHSIRQLAGFFALKHLSNYFNPT